MDSLHIFDPFECFCCANDINEKEIVVLLTACFDESYNHYSQSRPSDPLLYTVACCLSTKEEWTKLKVRWGAALNRKPKIEHFHMTDFESRKGDFAAWSESERLSKLRRLHGIMDDHIKFGVAGVVNCEEFDKVALPRKKHRQLDYYLFDVIVCMDAVANWCNRSGYDGPVHYFFAHLNKQGAMLDEWFEHCLNTPEKKKRYRLSGSWSKGLTKDFPQLQAVDIIAYELNKRAVNEFSNQTKFTRKSLGNLKMCIRDFDPLYYGAEEISRIFDEEGLD